MATIIKEKNMLYFTNNQGRTYSLNINEGGFVSTQGKPMASVPSGFVACMRDMDKGDMSTLLRYMRYMHDYCGTNYMDIVKSADMLTICDKLDAIGFKTEYDWDIFHHKNILETIADNFKAFARAYKENANLDIKEFCHTLKRNQYIAKYHITNPHIIEDSRLVSIIETLESRLNAEDMPMAMYYINKGLLEFCSHNGTYDLTNNLHRFFNVCDAIGYTPTKDDYYRQYINVMRTYKVRKQEIDSKAITAQLTKHAKAWEFENNDFTIIVPSTPAEFEAEAKAQCNCVYSTYMGKVIRGETNVVFIRRKSDPTVSYITCEVTNEGRIKQFLLKHNYSPAYDSAEDIFKIKFAKYLAEVWA